MDERAMLWSEDMSDSAENIILDFNTPASCCWESVDDRIMGGCSQSHPQHIESVGLHFAGKVSVENDGGFASIRSATVRYDLTQYSGLKLRLRGDGKSYKLSLRTDQFFDGVSYQSTFKTTKNTWQEISLPFSAFTPTHHGVKLSTVAPMDIGNVTSFGLFISDRQEGLFQLDVAWVKGV
jgi:NADH dehydrogenase [ubiquinone] 1 alpha subcomplex assembly factor 1